MKIGIYGGSFNPVHFGHTGLAEWVLGHTDLDEIWFMVSPNNPLKEAHTLAPEQERLEGVRKAVQDIPGLKASDFEFSLPRPSYTANTLRELQKAYPQHEFSLIIGEDNYRIIDRWKEYEYILSHFRIFVYPRHGVQPEEMPQYSTYNIQLLSGAPLFDISSSFLRAQEYLYSSRPPFHIVGAAAYKPGLDNMLRLMAHLGNPHEQLRAVHVAGTNGKGSTSHLIAAALQAAGLKVGLYTSPHLVSLTERIRINGTPIPKEEVVRFVEHNRAFLDELQPSFFETMTAMAFAYFAQEKVDVAVVETGLGGRLDSTNILTPILSVITNIGMDHTEFLGSTLPQIAREKAGIIKPGVPCVIGETHPQTMNVFLDRARECGILGEGLETTRCRIWFADQCGYLRSRRLREAPECDLKGIYQDLNLQTAYVALQVLRNDVITSLRHNEKFTPLGREAIAEGFAHCAELTGLHGRWETLKEHPLVICDTGHNSHGIQYVAKQLKTLSNPHVWIVFGMVNDKDTDVVMRLLPTGEKYRYLFTRPDTQRARSAEEMLSLWGKEGKAIDKPDEAIRYALEHAGAEDAVFIGGSNYLVGYAISLFAHKH